MFMFAYTGIKLGKYQLQVFLSLNWLIVYYFPICHEVGKECLSYILKQCFFIGTRFQ